MTLKSGTGQACAACKYQRRRCTPECLLAPFFPADQPNMFRNVHRLFGVKNIQNLLKELPPDQKPMAMKSIKFHAAMRDKYPVYGCLVEIQHLTYQIQMAEDELQSLHRHLAYYRHHHHHEMSAATEYLSDLHLGMAPPGNTAAGGGEISLNHDDFPISYLDFKDTAAAVESFCNENGLGNTEMPPAFFDQMEDSQQQVVPEEMEENELKSAAAGFTLTSVV